MKLWGWLEKLINEHGSAAIMEKRLALKDDEIAKLKLKIAELQAADEKKKVEADEVRIHKGIEFRRGIQTAAKWMAFCPKCHLPAEDAYLKHGGGKVVVCTARCGWQVFMKLKIAELLQEMEN